MDTLQENTFAYLQDIGCHYRMEEEENLITFAMKGINGVYPVFVYAKLPFLVCIAKMQLKIPDSNRLEVAEYLHRVNYGLLLGSFELDYEEGELRFRTALMTEDGLVRQNVLDRYIQMPAAMLDRYAAGVYSIVYDGQIAALAVRQAEGEE